MTVGYNDVRVMPKGELTKELMKFELEDDAIDKHNEDIHEPINIQHWKPNTSTYNGNVNHPTHRNGTSELTNIDSVNAETTEHVLEDGRTAKITGSMNAKTINDEHESKIVGREIP